MHDCVLGREREPMAPRVERTYYAGDGIDGKNRGGGGKNIRNIYIRILTHGGSAEE